MASATRKKSDILTMSATHSNALTLRGLLSGLPTKLKTPGNLALLKIYFLIPQPSVRRFVLMLFARITGDADLTCPLSDLLAAEYLLAHNAQLPSDNSRDMMLALVRQVVPAIAANSKVLHER